LHKPSFFAILGLSAIIIASTGYSFLIVGSPSDAVTIPMTAIVTVCIILGTALVILGYEIQGLKNLAVGRGLSRGSQPGAFSTSSVETPHYPPIIIGDESPLEEFKHAPDPAREDESEKRLEKFRDALRRVGKPVQGEAAKSGFRKSARGKARRVGQDGRNNLVQATPPKSFRVSLIGRTEIVLLAVSTGEEVKLPVDSADVLEMAWHAFAKGMKVRPIIESGRIARLEAE
jgi:hypothetical protein